MPSPEFIKLLVKDTPQMNSMIANGFATHQMQFVEKYIDDIFKQTARTLPEEIKYIRFERCTPQEEFAERTRRRENRSVYEIARTDFFMVKYFFEYQGKPLPTVYMYLPFCGEAGVIHVSGSKFNISPVLMDKVISIGVSSVFIGIQKGKITYKRSGYPIMKDGVREEGKVIWGWIYNKTKKLRPTTKAMPCIPHYLFAKYGVTETYKKFANVNVVIGTDELKYKLNPEEYVVYSSCQVKPKLVYTATNLVVGIPRAQFNNMAKSITEGLFYIADHFPDKVVPEYLDSVSLWMVLLGHINQSGIVSHGILHSEMETHMRSVDEYLDEPSKDILASTGVFVDDFYELSALTMDKFNEWTLDSPERAVNSMYKKHLTVLPHILYDIQSNITKMGFRLKTVFNNIKDRRRFDEKNVSRIIGDFLKPGRIYGIRKNHRECSSMQYCGDNKAFKITSILIPQSELSRGGKNKRTNVTDATLKLHSSIVEVGGFINLPKTEPSGRSRINLFVKIDEKGVIVRDANFEELLDTLQDQIS